MALSHAAKKTLLERTRTESGEVRSKLRDYMARTGMNPADFGRRINYSGVTVRFFLDGRYENVAGNDSAIRAAADDYMDAHPVAPDLSIEGTPYLFGDYKLIRRCFYEALEDGVAYPIYGPPGTRKTYLGQYLIAELNRRELPKNGKGMRAYRVYCKEGMRPTEAMQRIARACGVPSAMTSERIINNLRHEYGRRRAAIIFDEAQHLTVPTLETIRELIDEPPHFGMLFMGSHNLESTFIRLGAEIEQWRERLLQSKSLAGLGEDEAREIIFGELGADQTAKQIASLIKDATVNDPRQKKDGRDLSYISARLLFRTIRRIKKLKQESAA